MTKKAEISEAGPHRPRRMRISIIRFES